jgi:hypothetical protein
MIPHTSRVGKKGKLMLRKVLKIASLKARNDDMIMREPATHIMTFSITFTISLKEFIARPREVGSCPLNSLFLGL